MRRLLMIPLAFLLSASAALTDDAAWSTQPVEATARWDALVEAYHELALRGEFDREAFLSEAKPIAKELSSMHLTGRISGNEFRSCGLFDSPEHYYVGPTTACNKLHLEWGLLLGQILETQFLQTQIAEPEFPVAPESKPAPQRAPVPET